MKSRGIVFGIVVLLTLSGCVGTVAPGAVGGGWDVDADNHWQSDVVVVSYESPSDDHRDYEPVVVEALEFWTENSEQYAGFDVELRQAEAGEKGDIHVSFVDDVRKCGESVKAAGCAPRITSPYGIDRPVDVQVRTGLDHESSTKILKHELGHTLGLGHDDQPQGFMSAKLSLTKLPETNATDRSNPWNSDEIRVHVSLEGLDGTERWTAEQQVDSALRYYDGGAGGTVPEDVSITRTDSHLDADVVVRFGDSDDCIDGSGSCGRLFGDDHDGDGAYEFYDGLDVVLVDLDQDAVAWHVGRWLGASFGHDNDREYPEPLEGDAGSQDRRSDWWT